MFGKSESDKSQDEQIRQILQWIQQADKNLAIVYQNNNVFIKDRKAQTKLNRQLTDSVNALVEKDRQHDAKDQEHDRLIEHLKGLGKSLEEGGG